MATNLTTSPYFDDFNENKNFHKILFKPGTVVQSRELIQLQTNIQNQISKLGKFVLSEGSKISGAKLFFDYSTIAVKIIYDNDILEELENYINLYVVSSVSKIVGKIVKINNANGTLFIKPVAPSLYQVFQDNEEIYVYESKELAQRSLIEESFTPSYTTTVANGSIFTSSTITANIYSQEIYTTTPINAQVGDIISGVTLNDFYSVISVSTEKIKINKPITQEIALGTELFFSRYSSKSVLEVGVTEGVFFSHGHFIKCHQQSIIPDENTVNPTCSVGLKYADAIRDYIDDSSLLDPAINSTNFSAPGADRYLIELQLTSKPISETENIEDLIVNEKYIELVRLRNGTPIETRNRSVLGDLKTVLERQLFDHAGHFIIDPFRIQFNNFEFLNANTSNLTVTILPGKGYFYGSEFETIYPVSLTTLKPTKTVNTVNSTINAVYGNSIKISNVYGTIDYANTTIINLYNSNIANSTTLIGTAEARMMQYGGNSHYDLYLTNIKLTRPNTTSANIVSIANSYQSALFRANTVLVNGKSYIQDREQGSVIFDYPGQVKEESVQSYTTKSFAANSYVISNKIIADAPQNLEYFETGNIDPLSVRANYTVVTNDTNGSFTKGQIINYSDLSVFANTKTAELTLINGKTYSGSVSVYVTYKVATPIKKVKNELYGNCVVTINSCNCACLWYSDINKVEGVWDITNKSFKGSWNSSTNYAKEDIVVQPSSSDIRYLYKCKANNVNNSPTSSLLWDRLSSVANFKISNGQTNTLYDHGRLYINTPGNTYYVGFTYFEHSAGNYLSAGSYNTANTIYSKNYVDPKTGAVYNLLNSADFRPRRIDKIGCQCCACSNTNLEIIKTNATEIIATNIISPIANNDLTANTLLKQKFSQVGKILYNAVFYLPKIDILVLGADKQFKIIQGVPSLTPTKPKIPAGVVTIATIYYKGGAQSINDINIVYEEHKRYTMDQIGTLDKRISRIEYYNSLTLSEQSIFNKTQSSTLLAQRLNSGFLADSFETYSIFDDKNPEFSCFIDIKNKRARPKQLVKFTDLSFDPEEFVVSMSMNKLHLPYTLDETDSIVTQNLQATGTLIVNPFNTVDLNGYLTIFPPEIPRIDPIAAPDINVSSAVLEDIPNLKPETVQDIVIEAEKQEPIENEANKSLTEETNKIKEIVENVTSKVERIQMQIRGCRLSPFQKCYVYINDILINSYCTSCGNPNGELIKLDIIKGGSGYEKDTTISLNGANTKPAILKCSILKNKIHGVDIVDKGMGYSSNTTVDIFGIGTGAVIKPYFTKLSGSDLITDKTGKIEIYIDFPNDEFIKFDAKHVDIVICDSPISPKQSKKKALLTYKMKPRVVMTEKTTQVATKVEFEPINKNVVQNFVQSVIPTITLDKLPQKTELNIIPNIVGNTAYFFDILEDATIADTVIDVQNNGITVIKKDKKIEKGKITLVNDSSLTSTKNAITNVNINSSGFLTFQSNTQIELKTSDFKPAIYTVTEKTIIKLPDNITIPEKSKIVIIESNLDYVTPILTQNVDANNKQISLQTTLDSNINFKLSTPDTIVTTIDITYGIQLEIDPKKISSFYTAFKKDLQTGNTTIITDMLTPDLLVVANSAVTNIEAVKSENSLVNQMNVGQFVLNSTPTTKNTFNPKYIDDYNKYYKSTYKVILDEQYLNDEVSYNYFTLFADFFIRQDANKLIFKDIVESVQNIIKQDSKYANESPDRLSKDKKFVALIQIIEKLNTLGSLVLLSYNINS